MSRTATMAYDDARDRVAPYFTVEHGELAPKPALLPVGWEAATEYHRLKKTLEPGERRALASEAAVAAVLDRARQVLRHQHRPMRQHSLPWPEAPDGELDLDASLDHRRPEGWQAEDLQVVRRSPWQADLALILDTSLSMTGEKLALLAVAAAVLALSHPSESLAAAAFDTRGYPLKRLGERLPPRAFVRRVLDVPAQGFTSMEEGLRAGLKLLAKASQPERSGILITDGVYNVGWDPRPLAHRFPHLHVVKIGHEAKDRGLCRDLAEAGRGRLMVAEGYEDLPEVCHRLVRALARGG